MEEMSPFSRRSFLAASAAGLAALVAGCTSPPADGQEQVTPAQVDSLAAQVAVQRAVVDAYAAAGASDPALQAAVAELAGQAQEQLDRLVAAAPGSTASASSTAASSTAASSTGASSTGAAAVGPDPKGWLRQQVGGAAKSHATACVAQTGARAALLGSIAAGLRGQEVRLA
jgi:hypothetical protein